MRSLSVHLRNPGDHGRLAFRADCPICASERLAGDLPSDGIVSRRAQAVLAGGVLALSAAAPATALADAANREPAPAAPTALQAPEAGQQGSPPPATEPTPEADRQQEGSAAPDQIVRSDPAQIPGFDPGGHGAELPLEDAHLPQAQILPGRDGDDAHTLEQGPAPDTGAPIEQEPAADLGAPVVDPGDEPAADQQPTAPAQPGPSPPPPPAPPAALGEPAPSALAPAALVGAPAPLAGEVTRPRGGDLGKPKSEESEEHDAAGSPPPLQVPATRPTVIGAADTSAPTTAPVAAAPLAGAAAGTNGRGSARSGDILHVVRAGESLWSIADELLGGNASAARIAREVHRLWELNKDRIATGDPDLLIVGTRLRLG